MSQAHEMRARFTQAQTPQPHHAHLELTAHEIIQAHPLRQQIPPRLRRRKLPPAFPRVGLQDLHLDQGHIAPARPTGKGPNPPCITISFQSSSRERPDPLHRLR